VSNVQTSYLRVRALPFTQELHQFVDAHDRVYVVEQDRDAQLRDLLRLEMPESSMKFRSVLHYDGLPIDARFITDAITQQER
jgi:2-oxoglutarate ferredoxin oxidoreductase subunit alpha